MPKVRQMKAFDLRYTSGSEYLESEPVKELGMKILGLEPYEEYEFRILAVNAIGRGRPSIPVEAQTREARTQTPSCPSKTSL